MTTPLTIVAGSPEWHKLRKRATEDLFWFADVVLGYGEKVPLTFSTHYAMARFAEQRTGIPALDDAHFQLISVPRGFGKSTLVTKAH